MKDYDVIIVGSGAAGCVAALSAAPLKVALVTTGKIGGDCSSLWTQGGLAAAVGPDDTPAAHARDTVKAGAEVVDEKVAKHYTATARSIVGYLEMNGVQFSVEDDGFNYILSCEGGHDAHRVLKADSGDGFGRALMPVLWDKIKSAPYIDIIDQAKVIELLKYKDGGVGGVVFEKQGRASTYTLRAPAVILATGGAAGLYSETTNPVTNTGQAITLAEKAGADLADLEFMQFHPTALKCDKAGSLPLMTEALRGHGATLVNDKGVRFMTDVHPMAELAPRDIVARAILGQQRMGREVYLDCRHIDTSEFYTLQKTSKSLDLDPARDLLPVTPAAHYHMGGVATDRNGRSSTAGLWVIGEAASTGFHGANRLASNSVLEAVIMGRASARDIKQKWKVLSGKDGQVLPHVRQKRTAYLNPVLKAKVINAMRRTMTEYVGILRNEYDLADAEYFFDSILAEYSGLDTEIEDMARVCLLITKAARTRTESRGGHYRTDYPERHNEWKHRSLVSHKLPMVQEVSA